MPIGQIIAMLVAAEPAIKQGVVDLVAALRDGKVSHVDVLQQLGAAEGSEHAAADALKAADKAADDAAEAALKAPK